MKFTDSIKNVLLVDDDTNITFLTKMALEELTDWHIEEAASGAQALNMVGVTKPDLILLDAMMPMMDGRETFAKLRDISELRDARIIFVTAKVQSAEVAQYLELGADGVITKPFDPVALVDEIDRVVSQSQSRRTT